MPRIPGLRRGRHVRGDVGLDPGVQPTGSIVLAVSGAYVEFAAGGVCIRSLVPFAACCGSSVSKADFYPSY